MTAFDLIAHPQLIVPPYWFYAIFVGAAVVVTTIGGLLFAYRRRIYVLLFSIVWSVGALVFIVMDVVHVRDTRARIRAGDYVVIEGCLERFHPGSPGIEKGGEERWSIAGQTFSYANGSVGPRYHLTAAAGGAVHPDSRVRVAHLADSEDILRLEIVPHDCPAAPDSPA